MEHKTEWKEKLETLWGWVSLAIILFAIVTFFKVMGWAPWPSDEISAYPVQCKTKPEYGICKTEPEYTLNKSTYKVNKQRQEVVHWISDFPPDRYTDCAIRDKNNWECTYDDRSGSFGFSNGNFSSYSLKENSTDVFDKTYYVSRREWLDIQARSETGVMYWLAMVLVAWLA